MNDSARTEIYRYRDTRIDVKLRPKAWFARIRLWSGGRWPRVEKTWYARARRWVPWFSLERQAVRAVEHANRRSHAFLPRDEVQRQVRAALQLLR